jgi:hypothetical protein
MKQVSSFLQAKLVKIVIFLNENLWLVLISKPNLANLDIYYKMQ